MHLGALALLVGAAGFEPATWSTQNSRATRLRYAPPGAAGGRSARVSITRFAAPRQAKQGPVQRWPNQGGAPRWPGAIPSLRAGPAITSSTPRAGAPEEM